MMINNKKELLNLFEADSEKRFADNLYKYTSCGAWIKFKTDGIQLSSIVEGCDFGCHRYSLTYPFSEEDYDARIKAIEAEASALWTWANEGEMDLGTDAPDVYLDYSNLSPESIY